jgi:hypothetical protein
VCAGPTANTPRKLTSSDIILLCGVLEAEEDDITAWIGHLSNGIDNRQMREIRQHESSLDLEGQVPFPSEKPRVTERILANTFRPGKAHVRSTSMFRPSNRGQWVSNLPRVDETFGLGGHMTTPPSQSATTGFTHGFHPLPQFDSSLAHLSLSGLGGCNRNVITSFDSNDTSSSWSSATSTYLQPSHTVNRTLRNFIESCIAD